MNNRDADDDATGPETRHETIGDLLRMAEWQLPGLVKRLDLTPQGREVRAFLDRLASGTDRDFVWDPGTITNDQPENLCKPLQPSPW